MQPAPFIKKDQNQPMADEHIHMFEMTIPSIYNSLDRAVCLVEEALKHAGLSEGNRTDVVIALSEVLVNAIHHGNREDATKRVHIRLQTAPSEVSIWVRDEGEGFDEAKLPDPRTEENLTKPTGRGILMMRSFMDQVKFYCLGKGTLVKMTKYLQNQVQGLQDVPEDSVVSLKETTQDPSNDFKDTVWWAGCCDPRLDKIAKQSSDQRSLPKGSSRLRGFFKILWKGILQLVHWIDMKTRGVADLKSKQDMERMFSIGVD